MNRSHIFLRCYSETGSVTRAATAAKIHRSIHYRRLKEDPKYKAAFDAAHEVAIAFLEDEAVRRATEGVMRTKYYQGIECGTEIEYSDSLLQFLLRGAKPEKYRERFDHRLNGNLNVTKFKGSLEELLATYRNLVEKDYEEDEPEAA